MTSPLEGLTVSYRLYSRPVNQRNRHSVMVLMVTLFYSGIPTSVMRSLSLDNFIRSVSLYFFHEKINPRHSFGVIPGPYSYIEIAGNHS